jgi:hypothetical protein
MRKTNLFRLLARRVDGIFLSDFRHACLMGLEGLVYKHRESVYRAGRSPHWIKVKNRQHPAFSRVCPTGRLGREFLPQPALGDFAGCSKRRLSRGGRFIFRPPTDYSCMPWATDSRRNADPGRGLISVGLLCSGLSASSLLRASCP